MCLIFLFGPIYTLFSIQKYNLNNEKLHVVFFTLKKFTCEEIWSPSAHVRSVLKIDIYSFNNIAAIISCKVTLHIVIDIILIQFIFINVINHALIYITWLKDHKSIILVFLIWFKLASF